MIKENVSLHSPWHDIVCHSFLLSCLPQALLTPVEVQLAGDINALGGQVQIALEDDPPSSTSSDGRQWAAAAASSLASPAAAALQSPAFQKMMNFCLHTGLTPKPPGACSRALGRTFFTNRGCSAVVTCVIASSQHASTSYMSRFTVTQHPAALSVFPCWAQGCGRRLAATMISLHFCNGFYRPVAMMCDCWAQGCGRQRGWSGRPAPRSSTTGTGSCCTSCCGAARCPAHRRRGTIRTAAALAPRRSVAGCRAGQRQTSQVLVG